MAGIDSQIRLRPGSPEPRGVSVTAGGINVAVYSANAEAIDFCLFDDTGEREIERIRLPARTGDVFHGSIADIGLGARYGFRAHGTYDPHAGHRFNPAKLLLDPHALAIDRPFAMHPALFGFIPATGLPDPTDSAPFMPKAIVSAPERATPWAGAVSWERMIVAELHVRGFTMLHPGVPEAQRGTFAGLATPAVIDHFKALGITAIEILPAAASLDERHLKPLGLSNYWNYNPVGFLAPDPRLAPGGWDEIRQATAALNAAGIELILDVVLNHSGESDAEGPTVSLRGLDNASYYRLDPGDRARYVNDAGCGNILAADRPAVVHLAMDALRAWAKFGGVNGFRFDLATTLGRYASGFDAGAPLLSAIEQDPILRPLRLIAEPWDIGPGGYQVGAFSGRWGEWNDRYRDDVRRFWRGDGSIADLATRLSGSTDKFWPKRRPSRGVNFITAHDGFTLADLVAYSTKHNDANGEHNRDGTDDNKSWNNGVEGPTGDPAILQARRRDQRNLLATLLLSRGTPMLGPGSDLGSTQQGNNNAYAQDNPISWADWSKADGELPGFIATLIALRANNLAIGRDRFLAGEDVDGLGCPDVVWRLVDGRTPAVSDWQHAASPTLVAVLSAPGSSEAEPLDRVVLVFHAARDSAHLILPEARPDRCWRLALDTGAAAQSQDRVFPGAADVDLPARTVMVFVEERTRPDGQPSRAVAPDMLDRLTLAAGIAPEWTEISGQRHEVGPETKQALLAAMGLPARSTAEARDRLDEIVRMRDRRVLPRTLSARTDRSIALRVAGAARLEGRRVAVAVRREDGSGDRYVLSLDETHRRIETAPDGKPVTLFDITLPPQPLGRHVVRLEEAPDAVCTLTVAPPRCHLPARLAEGGSAAGAAAHLYTLRSRGDGGIGDFSTLGHFAETAARAGDSLIGINPIHALFANDRERASPYNPSDRRFLDPIYLDVSTPDILGEAAEVQAVFDRQASVVASLRAGRFVDYPAVWACKRTVLEAAFDAFDLRRVTRPNDADQQAFSAFVAWGADRLRLFATFEAVAEAYPRTGWQSWPTEFRDPADPAVAAFGRQHADRVRFHLYLQWLSDRQLGQAVARGAKSGLDIGLYRDLAVGCAPDGAEAWAEQAAYARGVSVGSPPDPFSASGQVWSLPPPNPLARHRMDHGPFGPLLEANMRHAGALRIDHAMGLSRLFWVPDGMPGSAGAYVAYDFEANLTDVALASHRASCLVIGEDLGTVQEGFREKLAENDILAYRVLFFERDGARFKPSHGYPRKAVACVATHDLAPLAGWWRGQDIAERAAAGQLHAAAAAQAEVERAAERAELAEAIGHPTLAAHSDNAEDLSRAVHAFIAEAPSMLIVTQVDDLVGEEESVNLPGTDRERPNWRRRLAVEIDAAFVDRESVSTGP